MVQQVERESAMIPSDEILDRAARDGSIDITEWPRVLESLLQRLQDIVHNDFTLPTLAPPHTATSPSATTDQPAESQPPPTTDKENAAPTPPVPSFTATSRPHQEQQQVASSPSLPPDLLESYNSSTTTLKTSFATSPPYTIQRLAELVLYPKRYYRHLPPYLQALDRVVSVTSPLSDFPLGHLQAPPSESSTFLTNGDPSEPLTEREGLGSDESLGGALLTPIPWLKRDTNGSGQELRTEGSQTIQGPNGAGVIETVSVAVNGVPSPTTPPPLQPAEQVEEVLSHEEALRAQGGVTQGELLRQEQEAGQVPPDHFIPRRTLMAGGAAAVGRESLLAQEEDAGEKPSEHPHARGPDLIGAEDMGPQDTELGVTRPLNLEAAVGRMKSPDKDAEGDSTISDVGDETVVGRTEMGQEGEADAPKAKDEETEKKDEKEEKQEDQGEDTTMQDA